MISNAPSALLRLLLSALFVFFLLVNVPLAAQNLEQDTLHLPQITVTSARFETNGHAIWKADSLPRITANTLTDRLLYENGIGIRLIAPGALATLSLWGLGPNRTPLIWEGLNLQSPMNGVFDASLIPLWPEDGLELRNGGQSAALGSGAMAGAIVLQQQPKLPKPGWQGALNMGAGSYGRREGGGKAGISRQKYAAQLRGNYARCRNDFPFVNTAQIGAPRVKQDNNFLEKYDIQQFNQLKINDKCELQTAFWHQSAYREIPPAMTEGRSEAWQKDRAYRAAATLKTKINPHTDFLNRIAWNRDFLLYKSAAGQDSSRSETLLLQSEMTRAFAYKYFIKTGVFYTYQRARVDDYADPLRWFSQQRAAAFAQIEKIIRNIHFTALLRQEWADAQKVPFTWSAGGQWNSAKAGVWRIQASRNFNMPTLNDRFWASLGKPDLSAEYGHSLSAGWDISNTRAKSQLTVFQVVLDDWILWQPGADGQFRPENLRKVRSRGVEWRGQLTQKIDKNRIKVSAFYQWLDAVNRRVYAGAENVLGKQLVYTPKHQASFASTFVSRRFSMSYMQQLTGSRFTTSDNQVSLKGFSIATLMGQYHFSKPAISLDFQLDNLWNKSYQVLAFRPMPGRNWRLGLRYQF